MRTSSRKKTWPVGSSGPKARRFRWCGECFTSLAALGSVADWHEPRCPGYAYFCLARSNVAKTAPSPASVLNCLGRWPVSWPKMLMHTRSRPSFRQ